MHLGLAYGLLVVFFGDGDEIVLLGILVVFGKGLVVGALSAWFT